MAFLNYDNLIVSDSKLGHVYSQRKADFQEINWGIKRDFNLLKSGSNLNVKNICFGRIFVLVERLHFDSGTRCTYVNSLILSVLMRCICMYILKVVGVLCEKWCDHGMILLNRFLPLIFKLWKQNCFGL